MTSRIALLFSGLFCLLVASSPMCAADTEQARYQSEVVVYGATPGGVSAAISAARMGNEVVLIAYQQHVGGMTASGLGKSDIEKREMIQGLFTEFVGNVRNHYVGFYGKDHPDFPLCRDGYYYEPSVAEATFESMLMAESNIKVLKGYRLVDAEKEGNRLIAINVVPRDSEEADRKQDSLRIEGRVFIDATYEGDLLAKAGADFRLGRESRDEFDEPHAGVIYFDYQTKEVLPGTTGEADDRLPAYTYRLCFTTDANNGFQLSEPPIGYERENYVGYFQDLENGLLDGPKNFKPSRGYNPAHFGTLVRALSVTNIPNQKTDVNINPRPLAFPFPEMNKGYIEGDEATRKQICDNHRNIVLGLIWFLQNDSEVPDAHRKIAREYYFPHDEFTDNAGFPFQMYIREGRRLIGEYTLIEQDITGYGENREPKRYEDSIAVGEFPIDSFPCQKKQPGDTVVLEGYLGLLDHITRPYEIPYRIMVPQKVDGLLVPVAASTTHVAFSSVRMEPTWMALGQAAGVAAHLAIQENVPARRIPIAELQRQLKSQGHVIKLAE
ncbi:FAD dependent oxidoreductase [Polystyrenella longa]|uniref:FAD dependent oxidoreductase n=1 Tax=Polystyrenella longa TaxID=2528007 RepID=A0A518CN92_9PLAN|nr:FAD-dependent oxidoreductase [Polystyrenella longa]QDU80696.1 FAD dependent oxidoreductase [Polystyrenella longa]